jgi:hypothetical protein
MNDFDYDVMQKKRIARGAYHRKGGSKSRRCPMSTDYMTEKQIQERNGPVKHYDLKHPMTWTEFKFMPLDLQQEYLQSLVDRFSAFAKQIAEELFDVAPVTLSAHVRRKGIKVSWLNSHYAARFDEDKWQAWLKGEETEDVAEIECSTEAGAAEEAETGRADGVCDECEDVLADDGGARDLGDEVAVVKESRPCGFDRTKEKPEMTACFCQMSFEGYMDKFHLYKMLECLPTVDGKVRVTFIVEGVE